VLFIGMDAINLLIWRLIGGYDSVKKQHPFQNAILFLFSTWFAQDLKFRPQV